MGAAWLPVRDRSNGPLPSMAPYLAGAHCSPPMRPVRPGPAKPCMAAGAWACRNSRLCLPHAWIDDAASKGIQRSVAPPGDGPGHAGEAMQLLLGMARLGAVWLPVRDGLDERLPGMATCWAGAHLLRSPQASWLHPARLCTAAAAGPCWHAWASSCHGSGAAALQLWVSAVHTGCSWEVGTAGGCCPCIPEPAAGAESLTCLGSQKSCDAETAAMRLCWVPHED